MLHHDLQLREEPANFIEVLDFLWLHGNSGSGHTHAGTEWNIQIDAGNENRVPLLIGQRHLRT
jgi:hypothetical protein